MKGMKYAEILEKNRQMGEGSSLPIYKITVLSNIVTTHLSDILEYTLRADKLNAVVRTTNYDNLVQESQRMDRQDAVVIFWELSNLIEGFHYKVYGMSEEQIQSLLTKVKNEVSYVLNNLRELPLVIVNRFSSLVFRYQDLEIDVYDRIKNELNNYIEETILPHVVLIDIDRVLASLSISKCVDYRFYHSSKALYTVEFYKSYAQFIKPIFLSINGHARKVLVLDGDNTLWRGIVGEDTVDEISVSADDMDGVVYEEIQCLAKSLSQKGILLGLCSKNNPDDIQKVFERCSHSKLKLGDFAVQKVNWDNKVTNLLSISSELNIGLNSMVFVDDSPFEIDFAKKSLPEIYVMQVPSNIHDYPQRFRELSSLFYTLSKSAEDKSRHQLYQQQAVRIASKSTFANLEDYLRSLQLRLLFHTNCLPLIPRLAQITQKTNQFNLTTQRYTENDLRRFIKNKDSHIYAFELSDQFGSYGVVGLCIVKLSSQEKVAEIDSFLMSCRIIGRNVEFVFANEIISQLKSEGFKTIRARYRQTTRNSQVAEFYDQLNFKVVSVNSEGRAYELKLNDEYRSHVINYIEVKRG